MVQSDRAKIRTARRRAPLRTGFRFYQFLILTILNRGDQPFPGFEVGT
jgi:hypothetical protein